MTDLVRFGGIGELPDGSIVTWTVSEGRRGRRWREVVARDGSPIHALLLETDPSRRFSHLELARADGLWTFHPETDGTLHGNHVRSGPEGGVDHVRGWSFAPGDVIVIDGSPLAAAAIVWALEAAREIPAGGTADPQGVAIRSDGRLEAVTALAVERVGAGTWRVGEGRPFEVDPDGLPVLIGGRRWPLEEG
jgi:hypothetical protein